MCDPATPVRVLNRALCAALLLLLIAPGAAAQIPPSFVLVDDMVLPAAGPEAVHTGNAWTNGIVPYEIDPAISAQNRDRMLDALAEIEAVSAVDFVPHTNETDWVLIRPNTTSTTSSWSTTGMVGGQQNTSIGSSHWNDHYILVHEMFHTLGFRHEHQRPDRSNFVTINTNNILTTGCGSGGTSSCVSQFNVWNGANTIGPYDFLSIMHYGQNAFSNGSGPTITCNAGFTQFQNQMGNRTYMTALDAQGVAQIYGAPSAPTITGITPAVATGAGGFSLTVRGTLFFRGSPNAQGVQGSRILVNGQPLPTTYVDPEELTTFVPGGVVQGGCATVAVENPAPAGGLSNAMSLGVAASTGDSVTSAVAGGLFGTSVALLGDVDGDTVDDFVVGAPGHDDPRLDSGAALVLSGASGQVLYVAKGTIPGTRLGTSVAAVGDLDGDGIQEFAAGGPGWSNGRGYVGVYSVSTGFIRSLTGVQNSGGFGTSVAGIGDVDGDGVPDIAVGAPGYGGGRGRVRVQSGATGNLIHGLLGASSGDRFGTSVAGGGTMDLDPVPDFIVGAPRADFNGTSSGRVTWHSGATGSTINSADGDAAGDQFGYSVAGPGPLDANVALGSMVVGAPGTPGTFRQGYVRALTTTNSTLWTVTGDSPLGFDHLGWSVAGARDLDNDGVPDVVAGATQYHDATTNGPGYVKLLSGLDGSLLHQAQGSGTGSWFGAAVAGGGDVDGDGFLDVVAGAPELDQPCSNAGEARIVSHPRPPAFRKVMITEVSWGDPDGLEITNFSGAPVPIGAWRVIWDDGTQKVSGFFPTNTTIAPGEPIVIKEPGGSIAELPSGTQVLVELPSVSTTSHDLTVALMNGVGAIIDEVRISDTSGNHAEGGFGGFRGLARRGLLTGIGGAVSVERYWGLDSNSGADWTEQPDRSFGLENRSSGLRGTDPLIFRRVVINETDDSPDYIELRNAAPFSIDLQGWSLLCSARQGLSHTRISPFPGSLSIAPGAFVVIGDGPTPPAELPAGTPYVDLLSIGGGNIPWTTNEYDCALYDAYGRAVDVMRTTGHDDEVVHNFPRAPSPWDAFTGAAGRSAGGDRAVGRDASSTDTDGGADFRPIQVRSMGSPNPASSFGGAPGHGDAFDVRLSGTDQGGGMLMIINAGVQYAGHRWSFAFSYGHQSGQGPLLGLGPDAAANYLAIYDTPPWFGLLDGRGSARLDVAPGTFPPGLETDDLFILQDPAGPIVFLTKVLEFDT